MGELRGARGHVGFMIGGMAQEAFPIASMKMPDGTAYITPNKKN
jgi:hypothetical protein